MGIIRKHRGIVVVPVALGVAALLAACSSPTETVTATGGAGSATGVTGPGTTTGLEATTRTAPPSTGPGSLPPVTPAPTDPPVPPDPAQFDRPTNGPPTTYPDPNTSLPIVPPTTPTIPA